MKLTFQSIELENFGSFNAPIKLELERAAGLYFLRGRNEDNARLGSNGAGKSTLWKALIWALYGKTANGLRTPDMQPWSGSKGTRVTVEFACDEHPHILTRTGTNRIALGTKEITQDELDSLLGVQFDAAVNTVVLPQGEDLFLDLKPGAKLALLTDTLALERWAERANKANKLTTDLLSEASELEGMVAGLKIARERADESLLEAKQASAAWEKARQARLEAGVADRGEIEKELARASDRLNLAKEARDGAGMELKALRNALDRQRDVLATMQRQIDLAKNDEAQLTKERSKLQRELNGLAQAKKCPTCGQPLKSITDLNKHKVELAKQITAIETKLASMSFTEVEVKERTLYEQVRRSNDLSYNLTEKEEKAEAEVNLYLPQVTELQTKLRMLQEQAENQSAESNPHTDTVAKLRRQLAQTNADIDKNTDVLDEVNKQAVRTKFWVKGFKDVQLFIIEEVLAEIEAACNAMLPDVGLDGWELHFAVERETQSGSTQRGLNVSVLSPNNPKPVRWECWSGGEGQRLRIIAALALSEVLLNAAGVQTNLEVLDEPTRSLSSEGTRDLCAFLASRAADLGVSTWWVDHTQVESAHFADVITVVKNGRGSYIEERAT